jgi:hypothetical protein
LVVKSGDAIKGLVSERDIVRAVSRHGRERLSWRCRTSSLTPWSRSRPATA